MSHHFYTREHLDEFNSTVAYRFARKFAFVIAAHHQSINEVECFKTLHHHFSLAPEHTLLRQDNSDGQNDFFEWCYVITGAADHCAAPDHTGTLVFDRLPFERIRQYTKSNIDAFTSLAKVDPERFALYCKWWSIAHWSDPGLETC